MDKDYLKYRNLAFEIKRNYPLISIKFDSKNNLFGKLIAPTKLFITKSDYGFKAIFSSIENDDLTKFGWSKEEQKIIFRSYGPHQWKEVNEILKVHFNELGFQNIIFKNVNKARISDCEEEKIELDVDLFGEDLIGVIDKHLLDLTAYNVLRRKLNLISTADKEAFGRDLLDAVEIICMRLGFLGGRDFTGDVLIDKIKYEYGDELFEIISSRANYFDVFLRQHFNGTIKEYYINGDDDALNYLHAFGNLYF